MKGFISVLLLCVVTVVLGDVPVVKEKRQSAAGSSSWTSSTTSVFTIPTPTTLPTVNSSQYDLSQHFCRLWRHQSVYADGKIYIDGGNTYVPDNNGTFNTTLPNKYEQGMNDGLLVLDLSQNFTNQDTFPYLTLHKGPQVPNSLIEGVLWFSNATRKIYQLGGWFSFNSQANPAFVALKNIPENSIWEFDIDKQTWAQSSFSYVNTGNKVDRPGTAASVDALGLNLSFIFEGYVQQRSDHDYINYTQSSEFKYLEGMLQLDTSTNPPTLTNISVPTYMGPRMNGEMVHVPVGAKGILVQIGGQTTMDPTPFGVPIVNANAMNTNINMSFVDILDLETGYWFRQDTFGVPDLPTGRSDICTVVVSAQDGSSHNIFVIAGVETYNSVIAYEDMWVLTLPTFQWKKVHTRDGGRYGHTCHAVGENLIIIGGMETTSTGGNVNYCSDHMPAEIFSLASLNYTGIYDIAGASRPAPVPADIVALIGGTSSGGAVVKAPKAWSDLYLQYVFDPTLSRPAYTPTYQLANATSASSPSSNATTTTTPTSSSSGPNVGAIVGGVVGGVVFLILLAIIVGCCLRSCVQRRHDRARIAPASELPSYDDSKQKAHIDIQQEMGFRPYQQPVELAGSGHGYGYGEGVNGGIGEDDVGSYEDERHDTLRDLSTPSPPVSPPSGGGYGGVPLDSKARGAGMGMEERPESGSLAGADKAGGTGAYATGNNAGKYHIPRKSVASASSATSGRLSRQSEISGLT